LIVHEARASIEHVEDDLGVSHASTNAWRLMIIIARTPGKGLELFKARAADVLACALRLLEQARPLTAAPTTDAETQEAARLDVVFENAPHVLCAVRELASRVSKDAVREHPGLLDQVKRLRGVLRGQDADGVQVAVEAAAVLHALGEARSPRVVIRVCTYHTNNPDGSSTVFSDSFNRRFWSLAPEDDADLPKREVPDAGAPWPAHLTERSFGNVVEWTVWKVFVRDAELL